MESVVAVLIVDAVVMVAGGRDVLCAVCEVRDDFDSCEGVESCDSDEGSAGCEEIEDFDRSVNCGVCVEGNNCDDFDGCEKWEGSEGCDSAAVCVEVDNDDKDETDDTPVDVGFISGAVGSEEIRVEGVVVVGEDTGVGDRDSGNGWSRSDGLAEVRRVVSKLAISDAIGRSLFK